MENKIFSSSVIVVVNNKILLIQRSNYDGQGELWNTPAGHFKEGETAIECAVRELYEETKISVKEDDFIFFTDFESSIGKVYFYILRLENFPEIVLSAESLRYEWVTLNDLNKYNFLYDKQKEILEMFIKNKGPGR
ncbi:MULTISPECIES: NUDIX hydrolase [Proteiniphilum]|uniref:NUDIX hydrolase n=1 Tax=Proteiniphilum TaxID=294702 RepID=UPI001EECBB4B|nr:MULTISPECIES: NUDIX hydrolase [Proteiniphilum]ULB34116.1 NUDIX hydrolase [Proteiniphilum propionicum]